MPMLEVLHDLIKFVQSHDIFGCDFVGVVKTLCCVDLHALYCDLKKK
jgi:hypothetical protein